MTRHLPKKEFQMSYHTGATTLEHLEVYLDEHSHSENS